MSQMAIPAREEVEERTLDIEPDSRPSSNEKPTPEEPEQDATTTPSAAAAAAAAASPAKPIPVNKHLRPNTLTQIQSHKSTRSQRSFAGVDGYTLFSEDEERQTPTDGKEEVDPERKFEVGWDGDDDPMNPRSRNKADKWLIVVILSTSAFCVTCTSALYTSTYAQLERDWGTSREVATLGLSLFVMGLGLGPMVLSPLSEFYGRRPIYIWSFIFFLIWLIPCAVARNIQTMLIARFFDGFAGSAFLSVAGGTVGDMFQRTQLSAPMMVYTASPFIGPEIGPIIGGCINQYVDWRWSFYVVIIWAAVQLGLIFFLVPETYHPVLLRQKAIKLRKETGNEAWMAPIEKMDKSILRTVLWSCIRPFQLLFLEQMCLNLCLLSAILLGILYLFFGAFPLVFRNNHGFTLSQTGLTFFGIFIGMIAGVCCDPLWRRYYTRLVERNGGESEPEFRLPPSIL
ncbi:hypothetical protein LTR50_002817 [Elasticomyces elasticus]|nr:hypothetical protein LTR50_002817 [Elasticomyces elasticus]